MLVLAAVVGLAGISILVTAAVMLVIGIAGAIAAVLPEALAFLGPLVVGLLGVVGSALVALFIVKRAASAGRSAAAELYREALLRQRQQFGTDAMTRAAAAEAEAGHPQEPVPPGHPAPRDVTDEAAELEHPGKHT